MTGAGWVANAQAGAICGYEGVGTLWLNAGTLPAHSGCFYLFNAPAARADRRRQRLARVREGERRDRALLVLVRGRGRRHDPPLQRRLVRRRDRHERGQLGRAGDLQRGRHAHRHRHAPRQQRRLRRWLGHALRSDAARAVGQRPDRGAVRGRGAAGWSASDSESGSPAVSYAVDGGARVGDSRPGVLVALRHPGQRQRHDRPLGARPTGRTRSRCTPSPTRMPETSYGPFAFRVDRTAPAQPLVQVVPDAAAATAGWWGHAPVAVSVSTATAPDVLSSMLRVYGPSGALVHQEAFAGAVTSAAIPASALAADGAYELDVVECDGAGHCATSSRAALRWDGSPPPDACRHGGCAARRARSARRGPHDLARTGRRRRPQRHRRSVHGRGRHVPLPHAPRRSPPRSGRPATRAPATRSIPSASVRGAEQRVPRRPPGLGRRESPRARPACAAPLVDEQPPAVTVIGAQRWSGGAQTVGLAVSDANGAAFAQVLLDGVPAATAGNGITVAGEGPHALRAVARDGAGNETVVERALGVDASAPVIGERHDRLRRPRAAGRRAGRARRSRARRGAPRAAPRSRRRSRPTARSRSHAFRPASRWTAPPWSCASRMPRARPTRASSA